MADITSLQVEYTVKELLGEINDRLGTIDSKLDGKADHLALVDLTRRVAQLENDRAYARGLGRASWAIVGMLVTIAGLLIPIVLHVTQ